jgi:F-type H+-transporting ATPase subunit b
MRRKALLFSAFLFALAPCVSSTWAQEPGHGEPAAPAGHGEPGHGQAAAHGASGHHEEGPVIENWFSWDYGPGKTHKHPPFGFALLNFGIFLLILYRLAGKSFFEFMKNRHLGVQRALDEAAEIRGKAEAELKRYEARISRIDTEVADLLAAVRKEAEDERARIIAAAEAQAEALRRDAETQIAAEIARARAELTRKVSEHAVAAAEAILRAQIAEQDQKRLLDDYVANLEGLSASSGRSPRPTLGGRSS